MVSTAEEKAVCSASQGGKWTMVITFLLCKDSQREQKAQSECQNTGVGGGCRGNEEDNLR